jgi:transposase
MIRIDNLWLATEPMDMRAGTDTALARVIAVFGAEQPHCAYLFANRRANRMKVLVHELEDMVPGEGAHLEHLSVQRTHGAEV